MQKKADKTQNTQTKTNPQNQRSGGTTFQFEDNRPEAILQRKLQAMADNSPQVKRLQSLQSMADNSSQVLQLQAFQKMADHCPKLQKALQLSALFNVQSASVLSQNQPNSMKFQGQLNTSTPPSSVQPNKTPRLSGDTALLEALNSVLLKT